jgi:pyruvate-formate lyase
MGNYDSTPIAKSDRIKRLVDHLYAKMPEIEAARAELITESFKATEGQPVVMRKARAFEHILNQTRRINCRKYNNRTERMPDISGIFI